jgi:fructose-1,6-bisphosphatase|tara:strand:- start:298 stop:510 length:213 start_codon:yes stop_codon:yes gene_type:complete
VGGKGGTISTIQSVVQSVIQYVTPSLGKAVVNRSIGGTTSGKYSDEDFIKDLDLITNEEFKEGFELIELK